jgi:2-haloacid dehalogenase
MQMTAPIVRWSDIRVFTFDCYGTLIDWEKGLLETIIPILHAHNIYIPVTDVLGLYSDFERSAEREPYRDYKSVLRLVMDGFAMKFQFQLTAVERDCLVESLKHWTPFPDTVAALKILERRFSLAVISNVDDDLFSLSHEQLGIHFDWVVTAEQAKSYKPSLNNFQVAFQRIGVPIHQIVHVAQSLYHDIAPANQMGVSCVWVNRRQGQRGNGATVQTDAKPSAVVPDMHSLVRLINL